MYIIGIVRMCLCFTAFLCLLLCLCLYVGLSRVHMGHGKWVLFWMKNNQTAHFRWTQSRFVFVLLPVSLCLCLSVFPGFCMKNWLQKAGKVMEFEIKISRPGKVTDFFFNCMSKVMEIWNSEKKRNFFLGNVNQKLDTDLWSTLQGILCKNIVF